MHAAPRCFLGGKPSVSPIRRLRSGGTAVKDNRLAFGGRRSVDAVSPSAFSSHGATGNTEEFQNFRFSACQHFPLRASPPRVASLLRYAPVAPPGLHICLSLWTCAIARVFAPAHVALRAALRQGWFAFLPECLTLRATHVAYRANPRLLGSQPGPLACVRVNPPPTLLFILPSCVKNPLCPQRGLFRGVPHIIQRNN